MVSYWVLSGSQCPVRTWMTLMTLMRLTPVLNLPLLEGISMPHPSEPLLGSPRCNLQALMWSVLEVILAVLIVCLVGCISVDKRVTVVVYPGGTAEVTTTNASETKADGNQLHADPDLSISPLPIP